MKYYVYQICRPDGTPFYVGFGKKNRLRGVDRNNRFVGKILAEIRESGLTHSKIVEEFDDMESAKARELELILLHRRIIDGGILANLRIGDHGGVQGRVVSEQTRQEMSARYRGRQIHTEEHKKQLSKSMKGNSRAKTLAQKYGTIEELAMRNR